MPSASTLYKKPSIVAESKKLSRNHRSGADGGRLPDPNTDSAKPDNQSQARIEILGEEMVEKRVRASANSGRVYLPPKWIGHKVKIIRID